MMEKKLYFLLPMIEKKLYLLLPVSDREELVRKKVSRKRKANGDTSTRFFFDNVDGSSDKEQKKRKKA